MDIFKKSEKYFSTPLQQFQFFDKYSRFNQELGRRETWIETVNRTTDFLRELSNHQLSEEIYLSIRDSILNMEIMPSMRLLAMAGPAARRNHVSIYNCSYMNIDDIKAFGEALFISMSGCGVGFSVERKNVNKLPKLCYSIETSDHVYTIDDSTEGWQDALDHHMELLFLFGIETKFDYSLIRPAGSILKTKGGRASGPEALEKSFNEITAIFKKAIEEANQGLRKERKLKPIEVHDIMCHIGECAVAGGTRRTAMISLFDRDDQEMLHAKNGDYPLIRANANNSAVWTKDGIDQNSYLQQMSTMFGGYSGEPGIFSRETFIHTQPHRRDISQIEGTNPCGEIVLRNKQFCNLSQAVVRSYDTIEDLKRKVRLATIVGTIQSMATESGFDRLRPEWRQNCEEERLLGVDLNGLMDRGIGFRTLDKLKTVAQETNRIYASQLNIRESAAITCNKPNGNASTLLDCSPGIHPRFAPFYIRNVRVSVHSPIYKVLLEAGLPIKPENGQDWHDMKTAVVSFPVKSPEGAITKDQVSALEMCSQWQKCKVYWTDHNPSVTIYYEPDEILPLTNWIWDNRQIIGGMTVLPKDGGVYKNAPYVEITEDTYNKLIKELPTIDWSKIQSFEKQDTTTASQEVACSSDKCLWNNSETELVSV